ncbi:unnamed protein product, partial [Urochloa humidicola]
AALGGGGTLHRHRGWCQTATPGGARVWHTSLAHKQFDGMPLSVVPPCTSSTYSPDDSRNSTRTTAAAAHGAIHLLQLDWLL